MGASDPLVVLNVFEDAWCAYSNRHNKTLDRLLKKYGDVIQIRFFQLPVFPGEASNVAAEAILAAAQQGKLRAMQDTVFKGSGKKSQKDLISFGRKAKLRDMQTYESEISSRKYQNIVRQDQMLGHLVGLQQSPMTWVNGTLIQGAQPYGTFEKTIKNEIKAVRALHQKGITSRNALIARWKSSAALLKAFPQLTTDDTGEAAAPVPGPTPVAKAKLDVDPIRDIVWGSYEAPVTLIFFEKFAEGRVALAKELKQLRNDYPNSQLLIAIKPLPYDQDDAKLASKALFAGYKLHKFGEMFDFLIQNGGTLTKSKLKSFAKDTLQLDSERFQLGMKAELAVRRANEELYKQLTQIYGENVPAYFVNNRPIGKQWPAPPGTLRDAAAKIIDEEVLKSLR